MCGVTFRFLCRGICFMSLFIVLSFFVSFGILFAFQCTSSVEHASLFDGVAGGIPCFRVVL